MKFTLALLLIIALSAGCAAPRYSSRTLVRGGELRGVQSLTTGPDGLIYAASPFSTNIAVIDPESLQWRFLSGMPLGMPWELAAVAPDRLVFYDVVRKGLEAVALNGAGKSAIIQHKIPAHMKLTGTAEGRLFAAMAGDMPELWEIDPHTGARLLLLAEKAGRIAALAPARDGGLWVAFGASRWITHVNTLTGEATPRGSRIESVTALTADQSDRVWAASEAGGQPRLWCMDIGVPPDERREFALAVPFTTMAAAGDALIACGRGGDSLWALSADVEAPVEFYRTPLVTPGGLCFIESGALGGPERLYAADMYSVKEFDPRTGAQRRSITIPDHRGRGVYPTNVAASPDFLIVTSWISGTVHLLDPESGRVAWAAGGLSAPQSAVVMPGGDVLVAELASSQIVRLSRSAERGNTIITTEKEGPLGPCGLVLAPKGGVYVTELFRGTVSYIDPYSFFHKIIAENIQRPEGLAVTPEGELLVVETGRQRLLRIEPESGRVSEAADGLPVGLEAMEGLPSAWFYSGVAAAKDGRIFLSSDRDNCIEVLTPR